jgi:hypothetical protein
MWRAAPQNRNYQQAYEKPHRHLTIPGRSMFLALHRCGHCGILPPPAACNRIFLPGALSDQSALKHFASAPPTPCFAFFMFLLSIGFNLPQSDVRIVEMPKSSAIGFLVKEFKELIPPTIFFAVGFNLVLLTTNLILNQYQVKFSSFLLATTGALIVGKSVLIAQAMPFFRRMDNGPLIRPVLYKTGIFFIAVALVRILEKLIEFLSHGGTFRGVPQYVATTFNWNQFLAVQLWLLTLFLIYTFFTELNTLFGDGELYKILFKRRPTEVKQTRRQRIRTLTSLNKLADAHSMNELSDPATAAHKQMLSLVASLAKPAV